MCRLINYWVKIVQLVNFYQLRTDYNPLLRAITQPQIEFPSLNYRVDEYRQIRFDKKMRTI